MVGSIVYDDTLEKCYNSAVASVDITWLSGDHGDTFFLALVVTDWWYGLYSKRLKKYVVKKSKKYRNSNPDFYVTGKLVLFNSRLIQGQLGWYFLSISSLSWYHSTHYSSKLVPMKQVRIASISNYSSVIAAIVSLLFFLCFRQIIFFFFFIN